jgi:hypothetical protein
MAISNLFLSDVSRVGILYPSVENEFKSCNLALKPEYTWIYLRPSRAIVYDCCEKNPISGYYIGRELQTGLVNRSGDILWETGDFHFKQIVNQIFD